MGLTNNVKLHAIDSEKKLDFCHLTLFLEIAWSSNLWKEYQHKIEDWYPY